MSHFDYNISIVVCCSNSDFYSVTVQDVQRVWTDTCKGDIHVNLNRNHLYSFTFFLLSLTWKWILKLLMGPWQKWSRLYNCLDIYLKHTSTLNWSDVTSPISSFKKHVLACLEEYWGPLHVYLPPPVWERMLSDRCWSWGSRWKDQDIFVSLWICSFLVCLFVYFEVQRDFLFFPSFFPSSLKDEHSWGHHENLQHKIWRESVSDVFTLYLHIFPN